MLYLTSYEIERQSMGNHQICKTKAHDTRGALIGILKGSGRDKPKKSEDFGRSSQWIPPVDPSLRTEDEHT